MVKKTLLASLLLPITPILLFAQNDESRINSGATQTATPVEPVPTAGPAPRISTPQVRVISLDPYYHGWPSLTCGKDGTLHLAYSGGRAYHVCPFGRLEYMVSKDGGESWSWPRVVVDSLTDDRDAGIVETKNGVLLINFFTSVAYQKHMNEPERLLKKVFGDQWDAEQARWKTVELRGTDEDRRADIGYWLVRSTDGGKTWSARYPSEPGYSPGGPIVLKDGRVFFAASNGKKAGAWISSDDGLTWEHLSDIPVRAGEMHAVEAADGTLIVHVRDKALEGKRTVQRTLQTESRDGGKTWSTPRFVTDGYPPHLLRLQDGTILLTYGSRTEPFGIRAKISRDNGQSWSEEFFITKDGANWDLGYPSTAQLPDGTLVTVWYETPADSHRAVLRQAKWKLLL